MNHVGTSDHLHLMRVGFHLDNSLHDLRRVRHARQIGIREGVGGNQRDSTRPNLRSVWFEVQRIGAENEATLILFAVNGKCLLMDGGAAIEIVHGRHGAGSYDEGPWGNSHCIEAAHGSIGEAVPAKTVDIASFVNEGQEGISEVAWKRVPRGWNPVRVEQGDIVVCNVQESHLVRHACGQACESSPVHRNAIAGNVNSCDSRTPGPTSAFSVRIPPSNQKPIVRGTSDHGIERRLVTLRELLWLGQIHSSRLVNLSNQNAANVAPRRVTENKPNET
mmetsp:Transcript_61130/g.162399  ORF Transcript_61130/g.162399 Transcript_61130/m.162399 type:complete len:277 (+) Transcript_61130:447-1277(+)